MRAAYMAAALALVSLSAAQTDFPTCADQCTSTFLNTSSCGGNLTCLCQDRIFVNSAVCCIYDGCNGSDAPSAFAVLSADCEGVGVSIANTCSGNGFAPTAESTSTASTSSSEEQPTSTTSKSNGDGGTVGTTSPGATRTTESTLAPTASTNPQNVANGTGGGGGLSSGAIAGIVIGALVAVAVIVGFILWLLLKNRKARKVNGNGEPTHCANDSALPGRMELQGKTTATATIPKQEDTVGDYGRVEIGDAGQQMQIGPNEKDEVTVAASTTPNIYELGTTSHMRQLSELGLRSPNPPELSSQPRAYEVPAGELPITELAGFPHTHSVVGDPGVRYGPVPHPPSPSTTAVGTSASPEPMQPSNHSLHTQYEQQQLEPNTAFAQHGQGLPGQAQSFTSSPGPHIGELSQLIDEHTELEARRQTLLQLQQIQEQQAALRSRISVAQQATRGGAVEPYPNAPNNSADR